MKSSQKKFPKMRMPSKEEIKEIEQWIKNLPPQVRKQFQILVRVETAQRLMKEFLLGKKAIVKKSKPKK